MGVDAREGTGDPSDSRTASNTVNNKPGTLAFWNTHLALLRNIEESSFWVDWSRSFGLSVNR
jgi:hypothetical protein